MIGKNNQVNFDPERQAMLERAAEKLNLSRLQEFLAALVDIDSPTGKTREAAEFVASYLSGVGITANYRPMNEYTGNVVAERRGSGGGAGLLLYAPLDVHLEGGGKDGPWIGPESFVDLQPKAVVVDDWVYGLGASNPKAMVATLVEVATAINEANLELGGDLLLACADGGMPVDISARDHAGMSNGILHLLSRGLAPDCAIILKPTNFVYHEEPGMAWFKLRVHGTLGYAGAARGKPGYRSSIIPAADVILELERWIIAYAQRNASGVITPHGWISGIRSGDPERPAFPSAVTEIFFDVRVNPRTTPGEVKAQFAQFIDELCKRRPELSLSWDMYGSVPGGSTDPMHWIIQSSRRAWEYVEGKSHPEPDQLAGQTDGAALRRFGVPTARVGWPRAPNFESPLPISEGLGGMGAAYVPDLMPYALKILYTVIDTLSRSRDELQL